MKVILDLLEVFLYLPFVVAIIVALSHAMK